MAKANKLIPVVDGTAGDPIELIDSRIKSEEPQDGQVLAYDSQSDSYKNMSLQIPTGTCNDSSPTAKTVTVAGVNELANGVLIRVINSSVAAAAGVTLNVNNLGAKPIRVNRSGSYEDPGSDWGAKMSYLFLYDAQNERWLMIGRDYDNCVRQNFIGSGYTSWRKVVLGARGNAAAGASTTTTRDETYVCQHVEVKPSTGDLRANSFIKRNGTSSQFLKADGSIDENTYITAEDVPEEVFVCNYDSANNTVDRTAEEIIAAKEADKMVICKFSYPTTDFLFLNKANSDPIIVFTGFSQTTSSTEVLNAKYHVLRYTSSDGWKFFTFNLQKQLASGTDIKTVNGNSLLGSGNITVGGADSPEELGIAYGSSTTAAATANKEVTVTSTAYKLKDNGLLAVYFANDVPANANLVVEGTALGIYYPNMNLIGAGVIRAGDTVLFSTHPSNFACFLLSVDRSASAVTVHSGTTAPAASLGSDGDIYIQTTA